MLVEEDDEPWPIARRAMTRRIIASRYLRRQFRLAAERDRLRWWTRAVPLWPPSVVRRDEPRAERPRRHCRRPVVRSRRCA